MEKDKLELTTIMGLADAADYLEAFAEGLRAGRILVERGEDSLVLGPPDLVQVEVGAKSKKGRQKFSLEVQWQVAASAEPLRIEPVRESAAPEVPEQAAPEAPAVPEPEAGPAPKPEQEPEAAAKPKAKPKAKKPAAKAKPAKGPAKAGKTT